MATYGNEVISVGVVPEKNTDLRNCSRLSKHCTAIIRTAELVIPSQERRRPGRGRSGDPRTEAELTASCDWCDARSVTAPENRHEGCAAAAEDRQEGM